MSSRHHAFVIEAEAEDGIEVAQKWAEKELGMRAQSNPDVVVLRYGLLSVEDARRVSELAASAPFVDENKVVIISASRVYHEAQNALLKLFEEPPRGTYLFLIMPSLGGLLPTLRSRVQVLKHEIRNPKSETNKKYEIDPAEEFLKANKEKRTAMIKKLTSGKDEEEKRENREKALAIVNGIEAVAYMSGRTTSRHRELLEDIQILRGHLHDRSSPVRMILEHVSLVIPRNLL
jgi:DNA polymerase III delta prime subunit